jgi:hypothetical protein
MSDPLQLAANALAKAQPVYAGRSAFPPAHYWIDGNELVILCADGRKVRGPLPVAATKKLIPTARPKAEAPVNPTTQPPEGMHFTGSSPTKVAPNKPAAIAVKSAAGSIPPVKKTGK